MKTVSLCRWPGCKRCAASSEASTIHSSCLELFVRECKLRENLGRLWLISAWRSPWRQALDLRLDVTNIVVPLQAFLDRLGLPEFRLLPPEIIQRIRNYSVDSLLWRHSSALDLAIQLSPTLSEDLVSIPLCQVSTWERGGQPVLAAASTQPPIIRLTVDSHGIRKIERLQVNPSYSN